eukprot:GHVR01037220.1.p1 GENE.GHVR01037220.1~~GHVR01037220.1.p1  ORF type:complete len:217 (-),score=28.99 GHVR01037220.1:34-642(-)
MPDLSGGEYQQVTKTILKEHWDEYWEFIEVLVGGTMFSGVVYFDLRPCLTNIRLYTPASSSSSSPSSPVFCLIDLDSFYGPRVVTPKIPHPYPDTSYDFIYGLWQAVVAAWAVPKHSKENTEVLLEKNCKEDIFESNDEGVAKSIYMLGLGPNTLESLPEDHARLIAGVYVAGTYEASSGFKKLIQELRDDPTLRQWVGFSV